MDAAELNRIGEKSKYLKVGNGAVKMGKALIHKQENWK